MSLLNNDGFIEKFRELVAVGSAKVTLHRNQVIELVTADLVSEYKHLQKNEIVYEKIIPAFEIVLSYYLTPEEMDELEKL